MLFQLIGGDIPYPAFGRERQNADLFSPFIDRQSASRPGLAARRVPDSSSGASQARSRSE
jgi:hypothetical protein